MKVHYYALFVLFTLLSCENSSNETLCSPIPQFDVDLFIATIEADLASSDIAGYQLAVNQGGNLYYNEAAGFARYEDDPGRELLMTIQTRQNVASVSKFIGAIALMNALETNLKNNNISVTDHLVPYLPETWIPLVHPDFSDSNSDAYLTFEKLLTMNTAINFLGSTPAPGSMLSEIDMLSSLRLPPDPDREGVYQNANFTLIRVLIGELIYNLDETSDQYFIDCSRAYFTYLRQTIFNPLNINAPLTPEGVEDYYDNTNYPLGYQWPFNANFSAPGDGTLGWQHRGNILNPGSSGLLLSARDLAKVMAFFKYDNLNTIISEGQRDQIFELELGLTTTLKNQEHGTYYGKNGAKTNDCSGCNRALRSAVVFFPENDVEAVLLTNYNLINPGLVRRLANAYDTAWVNPCN